MPDALSAMWHVHLHEWRSAQGISRSALAKSLGISARTLVLWEAGQSRPKRHLDHRLSEMRRGGGANDLMLTMMMVERSAVMAALFDFSGLRLICTSRGMRTVWPNFCSMIGTAFQPFLVAEVDRLMGDRAFVRRVLQGDILGVTGLSDRHISLNTDPAFRHRWTVSFKTYGLRLVAELSFDPCRSDEPTGLCDFVRHSDIVG